MTRRRRNLTAGLGVCLLAFSAAAYAYQAGLLEPGPRSAYGWLPGERAPELTLRDVRGGKTRLSPLAASSRAVVIAFTDVGCPVASRYAPRLARMEEEYADRGVAFVYVNANPAADKEAAQEEIEAHGFTGRYVLDSDFEIAGALRAATTTEVFAIDAAGTLVYRGAIDDQYGITYTKPTATADYLRDALDAVLDGEAVETSRTEPQGCVLPTAQVELGAVAAAAGASARRITYHGRVSRIIQNNCQTCHRTGGVAPFALETYEQVSGYRAMISYVLDNGIMPPWFAKPGVGEWANERRLTERDRADLLAWIDAGAPAGDERNGPLPRVWANGWNIGEPDAVIEIPAPIDVPAEGVMDYQYVYVKTDFPEDRWIERMELRPTAPDVTHHVLAFLEEPDAERRAGGLSGYLAVYVPGAFGQNFPAATAKLLPKGAWLKFQLHYTPNGTPRQDRTRIGFVFADQPPERIVETWSAVNTRFVIPPGAERHPVEAERVFRQSGTLLSFLPHMHLRGAAFRYELVQPDGTVRPLLDVPRYDFNWQLAYVPSEPIRVEAGSRLHAYAWYDNSANNPANPDPTTAVRFGEQSFEEMMIGYFDWLPDAAGDLAGR